MNEVIAAERIKPNGAVCAGMRILTEDRELSTLGRFNNQDTGAIDMPELWNDADGTWIRLDDGELCGPYRDEAELFLSIVGEDLIGPAGQASDCPWGNDPACWVPAAVALSRVYAGQDGRLMPTKDEADAAVSAIVNAGDDEAWNLYDLNPELIPAPATERTS